jgi:hypothetical protein
MRRVCGGIKTGDNPSTSAAQAESVPVDDGRDQGIARLVEIMRTYRVLKAGQGRLRG